MTAAAAIIIKKYYTIYSKRLQRCFSLCKRFEKSTSQMDSNSCCSECWCLCFLQMPIFFLLKLSTQVQLYSKYFFLPFCVLSRLYDATWFFLASLIFLTSLLRCFHARAKCLNFLISPQFDCNKIKYRIPFRFVSICCHFLHNHPPLFLGTAFYPHLYRVIESIYDDAMVCISSEKIITQIKYR